MTQPRSPSAGMAAFAALAIGAIVAVIVDAVLTVGVSFLFEHLGYGLTVNRVIGLVFAVVVGALVGGATLIARPAGPVIPVLAAVLAIPASFCGDLLGIAAYGVMKGRLQLLDQFELYVESYTRISVFGLITLLLYPAVAFGLSALRHLRRPSGTRNAPQPWGGPYGGQPQFQPPQPGFQQPPPQPYQQPGFQQQQPPPQQQPYQQPPPPAPPPPA